MLQVENCERTCAIQWVERRDFSIALRVGQSVDLIIEMAVSPILLLLSSGQDTNRELVFLKKILVFFKKKAYKYKRK